MLVVSMSATATSEAKDKVVSIERLTKVTMRWRRVSSSQSSRNLKAPSLICNVTNGISRKHIDRHTS